MPINAYEVLAQHMPSLIPTLDANHSVSEMLRAYFTYVAHVSADQHLNASGLKATFQIVDEKMREDKFNQAKIQIDFTRDPSVTPAVYVEKRILWQRNLVIARVMEVNANIRDLARAAVAGLESWAARHEIPWADVRCGRQVIVRRGGNRMEIDLGQKQWLQDEGEEEVENADISTMRGN